MTDVNGSGCAPQPNPPDIAMIAIDEDGMATFHDPRTDTYFEARLLGDAFDTVDATMVMKQGHRDIGKTEALQRVDAYAKRISDAAAYAGFKAAALNAKRRNDAD